jgi:hypothetical protein
MAGAGAKLFSAGAILTAEQVNTYLMDQTIMKFASTTTRDAAFGGAGEPTLSEGMFAYTSDTDTLWYYTGSAWAVATLKPSLWIPAAQFTAVLGTPTLGTDGAWSATAQSFRFGDVNSVENCITSFYISQTGNLNFEAYYQGGGSGNFRLGVESAGNRNPGTPGDTMFSVTGYNKSSTVASQNGLAKVSFTDNMSVTAGGLVNMAFFRASNDAGDTSANTCFFFGIRAYYV